jgi:virulence-associated protein VapD
MLITASSVYADVPDLVQQHPFDNHAGTFELPEKHANVADSTILCEEAAQQYVFHSVCSHQKTSLNYSEQAEAYFTCCFELIGALKAIDLSYLHYQTDHSHSI